MKRSLKKQTMPKKTPVVSTEKSDNNDMLFYSLVALSSVAITTLGYFGYKQYKKYMQEKDRDCVETLVVEIASDVSYPENEDKLEVEDLPDNDDEL